MLVSYVFVMSYPFTSVVYPSTLSSVIAYVIKLLFSSYFGNPVNSYFHSPASFGFTSTSFIFVPFFNKFTFILLGLVLSALLSSIHVFIPLISMLVSYLFVISYPFTSVV